MSQGDADIRGLIGATGSGKSYQIKRALQQENPARLIVWDPKGEYWREGEKIVPRAASLADLAKAACRPTWRLSYHPPMDRLSDDALVRQFEMVCQIVATAGRCMFIAEELSMTTKAGHSPRAWRNLIVMHARDRAVTVIGTTQRPALVDKTFFSNATSLAVSALNYPADRKAMADAMDVPMADVAALNLKQWLTRDRHAGEVRAETLNPGARKQKKSPKSTPKSP